MSLQLSSVDVDRLKRAVQILVAPLDYPDADAWRRAANTELRDLLDADSAGFLLPDSGSLYLYSSEHDPVALSRYPDFLPPDLSDGRSIFAAMASKRVGTLENTYGHDWPRYLRSEYYNEYAGANGAHDTLAAMLPLEEAGAAGLQFWHEHPTRRKFGAREVTLLEIVYPALRAGILTHLRFRQNRANLFEMIDRIGDAFFVFDGHHTLQHQSPSATDLLRTEPECDKLLNEISRAATLLGETSIATASNEYRIRCFTHGKEAELLTDATVERVHSALPCDDALAGRYGLTKAEAKVARLIAVGKTNGDIAGQLFISVHTVKRHVEKILMKMSARSRSDIRALISSR